MSATFTVDTRQFDRAMVEYAAASGKDFAEACNHQALNLAIKTYKRVPFANRAAIKAVAEEPWYPKLISKLMTKKYGRGWTHKQAKAYSNKLIRGRVSSIKYLASGFKHVFPKFGGKAAKGRISRNNWTRAVIANVHKKMANWFIYYRSRSAKDKAQKERILNSALMAAVPATVADMKRYVTRKLRERSRRHSARR